MLQALPFTKIPLAAVLPILISWRVRIFSVSVMAGVLVCLAVAAGTPARAQSTKPKESNQQPDRIGGDPGTANTVRVSEQTSVLPDKPEPHSADQLNPPSLLRSPNPKEAATFYVPITMRQRLQWVATATFEPRGLLAGVVTSGFGTARDKPPEDGPGWSGFGERFGMRLTGIITSNATEAGLGAMWGEDPRYFGTRGRPFRARVKSVVVQTFVARHPDGQFEPAYARYMAITGSNFLSNTWRPNSEANVSNALTRTAEGFAGRMCSNAFDEFWPDVSHYLFHRHDLKP